MGACSTTYDGLLNEDLFCVTNSAHHRQWWWESLVHQHNSEWSKPLMCVCSSTRDGWLNLATSYCEQAYYALNMCYRHSYGVGWGLNVKRINLHSKYIHTSSTIYEFCVAADLWHRLGAALTRRPPICHSFLRPSASRMVCLNIYGFVYYFGLRLKLWRDWRPH